MIEDLLSRAYNGIFYAEIEIIEIERKMARTPDNSLDYMRAAFEMGKARGKVAALKEIIDEYSVRMKVRGFQG